jgi:hypothetical protein
MEYTPSEIEKMIDETKSKMQGLSPIDPDYIELDYDLDNLHRELQTIEDNMARLKAEDDYYQEKFVD